MSNNIRITLNIAGTEYDVSELLMVGTLSISETFCNDSFNSTLNSARFTLDFNEDIHEAIQDSEELISVNITDLENLDVIFDGVIEPVLDTDFTYPGNTPPIELEAVDFTYKLDEKISSSVNYPSEVDGVPFWIYKKDNESMSILYRLLEIAGLTTFIDSEVPDIPFAILHFSATKGELTYRELIDSLLVDYGFCITAVKGNKISWDPTAFYDPKTEESIDEEEILANNPGSLKFQKRYIQENGVVVSWPKTNVKENALLWRGNLPTGDTSEPIPGEPIVAGDYWPEDSDIIETWLDFETEFLDSDYLEGKTRLKNENILLISSSNQYIKDIKDDEVVLDELEEGVNVIYEPMRAMLRYHNTSSSTAKLYWTEVYGKALFQEGTVKTAYPNEATNPLTYQANHIYDAESAENLCKIKWSRIKKGNLDIQFSSQKNISPGAVVEFDQAHKHKTRLILITSRDYSYDFENIFFYSGVTITPLDTIEVSQVQSLTSGQNSKPAQDGSSSKLIYKRAQNQPTTPVGVSPEGWIEGMPEGSAPLWMSSSYFTSTGDQVGSWTTPVRVSGIDKGSYRGVLTAAPEDAIVGDFFLYSGETITGFAFGHIYAFVATGWTETFDSDKYMAAYKDARELASSTGQIVQASVVVANLILAEQILLGGSIRSDYYNEDGSVNPNSTADKGLYMNSNGEFKAFNGTFSGLLLSAMGFFSGSFITPTITSEAGEESIETHSAAGGTSQARTMADYAFNTLGIAAGNYNKMSGSFQGKTVVGGTISFESTQGQYIWPEINPTTTPISYIYHYVNWTREKIIIILINSDGSETTLYSSVQKSYSQLNNYPSTYPTVDIWTDSITDGTTFSETLTLDIYTGGDVLKIKNLPTSAYGLEEGRVYTENGYLKVAD